MYVDSIIAIVIGILHIAQREIPEGHMDGLNIFYLIEPCKVSQIYIIDEWLEPWGKRKTYTIIILDKRHLGTIELSTIGIRPQGHTYIAHTTRTAIAGDGKKGNCRGNDIDLALTEWSNSQWQRKYCKDNFISYKTHRLKLIIDIKTKVELASFIIL